MLHDVVIVGAGPVGATLALALSAGEIDVVALDARPARTIARGDRSLALSHGSRLIFERLGIWGALASRSNAVTPITAIDISQRGGFGAARLDAQEQGVPALGYVVSYRALQAALDAALAPQRCARRTRIRCRSRGCDAGVRMRRRSTRRRRFHVDRRACRRGGWRWRNRRRRQHGAATITVRWRWSARCGCASRTVASPSSASRRRDPMALLPDEDHYGLVWTTTPERGDALVEFRIRWSFLPACDDASDRARASSCVSLTGAPFRCSSTLPIASSPSARCCLATPRKRCIRLRGRDSTSAFATRGNWRRSCLRRRAIKLVRASSMARYAQRRRTDRWAGIAFTHGLLGVFGNDSALLRWPRGLALTLLDALPPMKRSFTRAMLFGMN